MNDREQRRYNTLINVDAFGQKYLADLKPDSKGAAYKASIAEIITRLETTRVEQQHPKVTSIEVLLDALLLDLKAIGKTARAVAQDIPGFADPFILPTYNPTAVLNAADSFIAALKKEGVLQHFIDHEASPDLLKNLEDDVRKIRKAHSTLSTGTTSAVGKTKAVGLLIAEGMKTVNYLDAIVTNKYARDAEVLRAWQTASHVERAPKREEHNGSTNGTASTEPKK
jgi:hypothetical protein